MGIPRHPLCRRLDCVHRSHICWHWKSHLCDTLDVQILVQPLPCNYFHNKGQQCIERQCINLALNKTSVRWKHYARFRHRESSCKLVHHQLPYLAELVHKVLHPGHTVVLWVHTGFCSPLSHHLTTAWSFPINCSTCNVRFIHHAHHGLSSGSPRAPSSPTDPTLLATTYLSPRSVQHVGIRLCAALSAH